MIQYPIIDYYLEEQNEITLTGDFYLPPKKGWIFIMFRRKTPEKGSSMVSIFDGLGVAIHPWKLNEDDPPIVEPNVCIIESFAPRRRLEIRKIFKEADKLFESEIFNTLGSTTMEIIADEWYSFKIVISLRNTIRVKIWPFGRPEPPDNDFRWVCVSVPYPSPLVSGNYFGIGIFPCDNAEYKFDNLKIEKGGFQKDYVLFAFDAKDLGRQSVIFEISAGARAKEKNGINIYVYDQENNLWQFLNSHTISFEEEKNKWLLRSSIFLEEKYTLNGKLYFLVEPRDFYPISSNYGISIDFCRLLILPTKMTKVYGMADVYILTKEIEAVKEIPAVQNRGVITIEKPDPVPVSRIIEILANVGGNWVLIPKTDYIIKANNPNERWSSREVIVISLKDIWHDLDLRIRYYFFDLISSYQQVIEESPKKIAFSDLLLFHYIPYYVEMKFDYEGDINKEDLEELLDNYIKKEKVLSLSSIIDFCYNNKVSYINLETLDVKIHHWDRNFVYSSFQLKSFYELKKNERAILIRPTDIRRL